MGIFDKIAEKKKKNTTEGFYFGATEAEGENKIGKQNFHYYFDDYLNILPQLLNNRFIFIGRKGAGKSAIAKYIKETAEDEYNSFSDLIRLNDIEIEKLVQISELKDFDNKELVIFEWLILVRLIKLILQNEEGIYTKEYEKLKKFIKRNSGIVEIDQYQINEVIETRKFEVKFEVLKHVFPSFAKYFDAKTNKAPFYKLINPLKEVVKTILNYQNNDGKEFWLLFDDLDVNFKENNKESIVKITELIKIAKIYNTEILKSTGARILIFLRDDIKEIIETSNTFSAKIFSSYEIKLNWYEHENFKINENKTSLKKFINKRIEQNFIVHDIEYDKEDPWYNLFCKFSDDFQDKTSFKYVIDYTFYRPRDLILFLKPIGEYAYSYPISDKNIKTLIKKYLKENFRELKNELAIYFSKEEILDIVNILREMAKGYYSLNYKELFELFEQYSFEKETNQIIKILSAYSIIIPKDKYGKLHFNYREEADDSLDIKECEFATHKSIYSYFNQEKI